METTEHLDKPATSGSAASTIKAEEYDLLILGSGAALTVRASDLSRYPRLKGIEPS